MSLRHTTTLFLQRSMESVVAVARRAVARFAENEISPSRIELSVRPVADDVLGLDATYHLSGPGRHQGQYLTFDTQHSPLRMLSADASVGHLAPDSTPMSEAPQAFHFEPIEGSWDGESVRIRATWSPTVSVPCLPLPQALPRIMRRSADSSRPTLALDIDPTCGLAVGGVWFDRAGQPQTSDELLDAVLVADGAICHDDFIVTRRLESQLAGATSAFLRHASENLAHLKHEFGEANSRFAWFGRDQTIASDLRCGCCSAISAEESSWLKLAWVMAAMWWHSGCRFSGKGRLLVQTSLQAFSWIHVVGLHYPNSIRRAQQILTEMSGLGGSRAVMHRLQEGIDPRPMARLALSMYEASRRDVSVVSVVREIGNMGWGTYMPAVAALKRLREAGVQVP